MAISLMSSKETLIYLYIEYDSSLPAVDESLKMMKDSWRGHTEAQ